MADWTLKSGDTHPPIPGQLIVNGSPVSLATADSVRFLMRNGNSLVTGVGTITNAATGTVEYVWQPGDTDDPGTYEAEWEVVWDPGKIETFPNDGYKEVLLLDDLDL